VIGAMSKKIPPVGSEKPISKEEFEKRDDELTKALDKLENENSPPKPKPEPIGGMF
jgi:hypothetical protein